MDLDSDSESDGLRPWAAAAAGALCDSVHNSRQVPLQCARRACLLKVPTGLLEAAPAPEGRKFEGTRLVAANLNLNLNLNSESESESQRSGSGSHWQRLRVGACSGGAPATRLACPMLRADPACDTADSEAYSWAVTV